MDSKAVKSELVMTGTIDSLYRGERWPNTCFVLGKLRVDGKQWPVKFLFKAKNGGPRLSRLPKTGEQFTMRGRMVPSEKVNPETEKPYAPTYVVYCIQKLMAHPPAGFYSRLLAGYGPYAQDPTNTDPEGYEFSRDEDPNECGSDGGWL